MRSTERPFVRHIVSNLPAIGECRERRERSESPPEPAITVALRWYRHGMRTTIDAAGRLVVPRAIREQVGVYGATEVEIELDGAAIRIEPVSDGTLAEEGGRMVIPRTGTPVTVESVERLRDADRR